MKITIYNTHDDFVKGCAERLLSQMKSRKKAVIGLSTGRTTGDIHRMTARLFRADPFDISGITFFGVDEVVNVPQEYSGACYTMIRTELLDSLGVGDENFVHLPTKSDDFTAACSSFRAELEKRGGIDFIELGLGENGHLAFNQPGASFEGRAGVSGMYPELESRIRRETNTPDDVQLAGVGLGICDIMGAKKIMLAACGANKSAIVPKVINGPVTEEVPGSILQKHPDCEAVLDAEAASRL